MRWLTSILAFLALVTVLYIGSIIWSLHELVAAVERSDGKSLSERTDMTRLRHSLTEQIVDAYLDRYSTGRANNLTLAVAAAYGRAIIDATLQQLLTEQTLLTVLRGGSIPASATTAPLILPSFATIDVSKPLDVLGRMNPIKPIQIDIQTGGSDPEDYTAITLRLENGRWKLAGLVLSRRSTQHYAEGLPFR